MASNKNQHFVPKVYLRNFSSSASKKTINLYNIKRDKVVGAAPIKGQCSKDYFYGVEPEHEHLFQAGEGAYKVLVEALECDPGADVIFISQALMAFAYLQHLRTEKAFSEAKTYYSAAYDVAFKYNPIPRGEEMPPDWVIASDTVSHWSSTLHYISDLSLAVIINQSPLPFISSDHPCVMTNKLYSQKLKRTDYGIGNSGSLIFMPLTPAICLMAYDASVYSLEGKHNGKVAVSSVNDVRAINELQALNCMENLYFFKIDDAEMVRDTYREIEGARTSEPHRTSIWVPDVSDELGSRFRRAGGADDQKGGIRMFVSQNVNPIPQRWPSILKFRNPAVGYVSDTAVGVVRKAVAALMPQVPVRKKRY